jgi:opacity protein-like surface antigen
MNDARFAPPYPRWVGNGNGSLRSATDHRGGSLRIHRLLPLLVSVVLAAGSPGAARAEFHLELGGALMDFDGPHPFAIQSSGVTGFPTPSQLYGQGPGFKVGASLDLGRHFALAARTGFLQVRDERAIVVAFVPDSGGPFLFPGTFHHRLTLVPTHVLLRYRIALGLRTALHAQAGIGVIAFTEKFQFLPNGRYNEPQGAYQNSFSYIAGVGVAQAVYRRVAIEAGFDYCQALPGDGDIWRSGDNPWFAVATLGLRFPL